MGYNFPNHFPPQCPPVDARAMEIGLYRMVRTNPPTARDFISLLILYPNNDYDDSCMACGLSTYSAIEGAYLLQKAVPKFKKYKIAYGTVKLDNGLILQTGSQSNPFHVTWWVDSTTDASQLFCVTNN